MVIAPMSRTARNTGSNVCSCLILGYREQIAFWSLAMKQRVASMPAERGQGWAASVRCLDNLNWTSKRDVRVVVDFARKRHLRVGGMANLGC